LAKGSSLQSVHLKARSTELVESEAKAKHLANTRKHIWEMSSSNCTITELLYKTDTCDVYTAQIGGTNCVLKKYAVQRAVDEQELASLRETLKPLKTVYHRNLVKWIL
jgi:hypothetical protein